MRGLINLSGYLGRTDVKTTHSKSHRQKEGAWKAAPPPKIFHQDQAGC